MRTVLAGFADLFAARPLLVALTLHEALGGWRTLPLPTADMAPFPKLRELYERGQRQGVFRADCPFEIAHGVAMSALVGSAVLAPRGAELLKAAGLDTELAKLAARCALKTKTLLACGAIAGPLFTVAWAVEGATRAHYQPLRHPVSSLELGDFGWTQCANFLVAGGLTLAFAIGLRRALRPLGGSTWGPLLVGAHAIGLLGAGIFVTDPVSGYPPGTPDHLEAYGSMHAALHDLFSVGTFIGLPIAWCWPAASPAGASAAGRSTRR
jgi:Protein of unknown function (DUF998)